MEEQVDYGQLSQEEIARRKEEMIRYFKGEMEFLTAQRDYQQVVTELEELRARHVRAQIMIANALAPEPEADGPQVPVTPQTEGKIAPSHERKLKNVKQNA